MRVGCKECYRGFSILGKAEDFYVFDDPRFAQGFPCPTPQCSGKQRQENADVASVCTQTTVTVFYRAIHGMPVGETAEAPPSKVERLLTTKRIVDISTSPSGSPGRTIVNSITLEGGTTLYLASSNNGACVYLVEEE